MYVYIVLVTIYLKFESYIPLGYIFITDFKHANIHGYHNLHRKGVGGGGPKNLKIYLKSYEEKKDTIWKKVYLIKKK